MKRYKYILILLLMVAPLVLVSCGGGAPGGAAPEEEVQAEEGAAPEEETQAEEEAAPEEQAQEEEAAEAVGDTVKLTMILVAPEDRWDFLLDAAKAKFEAEHPGTTVEIDAQILPFDDRLTQLRAASMAGTPIDIVSLDQPEVGDFASAGFTMDLTPYIDRDLDGLSDWLPAYREATKYQGGWHAIWAWTDARVLWYWKDMVEEAGVDPATDMRTWDGYLESCQKLDDTLSDQGVEGCLLVGQSWISDWTLPYVWMKEGDLGIAVNTDLAQEVGAVEAWIPMFDSDAWAEALAFTREQVDIGIDPFTEHQFGPAFVDRRYATWLGGTWVYGSVRDSGADMSNVGLVGAFPVPEEGVDTATMGGGWTLAIPSTSEHPDIAWDFLKAMLDVSTMGELQTQYGYSPTQISFATDLEDQFAEYWNAGEVDRWSELQALGPFTYGRPSFPSWPEVGAAITEMIQKVQFDNEDPAAAAQAAQETVLTVVLGWPEGTTVELHDDSGGSCEHADVDRLISAVTPVQKAADSDGNGSICSHVELP